MSKYKRVTITSLAIVLSILFIVSTALCKPPDDKPGKPELKLVIKDGENEITEVTLTVGDTRLFKAEIVDDESIVMSQVDIEWRVLGGIGEISPNGSFTATKVGRGMVGASAKVDKKPLTAYVVVKVAEGEPPPGEGKRIVVTVKPDSVELPPGGTQRFEVEEPTVESDGNVQWRVIPPKLGYIVQDGKSIDFTGQDTGRGLIIATVETADGKGTGRAKVLVTGDKLPSPGPKLKINIIPKHARVDNGGSVEFEAKLTGLKGQYPALEWRANPTDLGDFPEGTTGYTALFTANDGGQGRVLVTVSLNTETEIAMGWATVDIGGPGEFPSKVKVSVEPEECSMVIGDKPFTFTANGVPTEQTAQLTWSVAPKRLGTIDDAGNFTPTAPGWGLIITKLDTEKGIAVGKAKVYVGTAGSLPVVITIEPLTAETSVNGGVTFEARVTDMQDNLVTDTPIQWKAVPGSLGTISETGVFSAGSKPGHVLITAKVVGPKGSATAQARVTINSSVATGFATGTGKLQVTVSGPESVSVNGTYTYIAFVEDVVDPGELEFKWRVASPSIGKVTAGEPGTATFTPRKAGRCVIIVDVKGPQGTGTGRISITVNE